MKSDSPATKRRQRKAVDPTYTPPPFDLHFEGDAVPSVLPVFSDYSDEEWNSLAGGVKRTEFFKGRPGEILLTEASILLGLGERKRFHPDTPVSAFRALGAQLRSVLPAVVRIHLPAVLFSVAKEYADLASNLPDPYRQLKSEMRQTGKDVVPDYTGPFSEEDLIFQVVYALFLGGSTTSILKTESESPTESSSRKKRVRIVLSAEGISPELLKRSAQEGALVGELAASLRYMGALPGNYLNPEQYEQYARRFAKQYGLKLKVIKGNDLEKQGFGGVIAVGKGSEVPPRVLILEYSGSSRSRPVVLVGKGITFDTGGISLKPPPDMHEMKYDMSGSALVLHSVALAAKKKLKTPVIALIGLAENMPDGRAIKPGDVYTAYNGLTVEVQNTDAEGRLVLGDLLSLACKQYHPAVMLDFATLTGACVIALGNDATAFMTASEGLAAEIDAACRHSLERGWRLPHWSVYDEGLKSDVADVRNVAGRAAGTVTAMRFLSRFVDADIPWAHLDIAGTAYKSTGPEYARGPSGWGMRFIRSFFERIESRPPGK
jgi:leucyl aminopeptidase